MFVKNLMYVAGGVGIGYYIARLHLEQSFEDRLDRATLDTEEYYKKKYEKRLEEQVADPEFLKNAQEYSDALEKYRGVDISEEYKKAKVETSKAEEEYEKAKEELEAVEALTNPVVKKKLIDSLVPEQPKAAAVNYNKISTTEVAATTAEKEAEYVPVVFDRDDFINNVSGFTQYTTTYFAGDHILANERDEVITDEARETLLGKENLELLKAGPEAFGGAEALYIRNDQLSKECEIIYNPSSYEDIVGPIPATG